MPEFTLRTLTDAPVVMVAGQEHRPAPRNLALLVRLRYAELPVPRAELGAWFWHGRQWRPNLSTALGQLRQVLSESVIPGSDDPVRLGAPLPADTDLIDAAAAHPTSDSVRAALGAYTAPFLWGLEHRLKDTREFVPWILQLREHYRTTLTTAIEQRCRVAAEEGAWDEIADLAAQAGERGLSSEAIDQWRRDASQTKVREQWPAPTKPGRRGWRRPAVLGAALALSVTAVLLVAVPRAANSIGPRDCRPGEAVGHLVHKEYKPEFKNPLGSGRTYAPEWMLRNDGRCRWSADFQVRRVASHGAHALASDSGVVRLGREVPPGDTITLSHKVVGPPEPGDYGEDWVLVDTSGHRVLIDGQTILPERFQVLPIPVPACSPDSVRVGLRAVSHPVLTHMAPNEEFVATWTLANTGRCIWQPGQVSVTFDGMSGRRLSDPASGAFTTEEPVAPSDAYTFEVPMRVPPTPRRVSERWAVLRKSDAGTLVRAPLALGVDVRVERNNRRRRPDAPECLLGQERVGWLRSERLQDNTVVTVGAPMRKAWTLLNEGDCTWPAGSLTLQLKWTNGPRPTGVDSVSLPRAIPPGSTYTFSVPFVAPVMPDTQTVYQEHWQLLNRRGTPFRFSRSTTLYTMVKVRPGPIRRSPPEESSQTAAVATSRR